ncbi:MAG TPA: hypothetical protein VFL57_07855 [Bryobacteraceae bacterium]|nr:hypothetical protein [Bryobacteraceae bacterium]
MGARGLAAESRAVLAEVALEAERPAEAAALANEAAEEFRREQERDQEIWARALYARSLAAQGRTAQAARIVTSVSSEVKRVEDVALRSSAMIHGARVDASRGNLDVAKRDLRHVYAEAAARNMIFIQLGARLALAEMDKTPQRKAQLGEIEKEARALQLGLIARRAALAASDPKRR